jgi:hypothetical protein
MAIWVFQVLFDIAVLALAVSWLLNKRLARIERDRVRVESHTEPRPALMAPAPAVSIPVEPTLGAQVTSSPPTGASNLSERTANAAKAAFSKEKPGFEAYEAAEQLIARGIDPREVARRTGLSLSELQLLGKISQRNQ